MKSNKHMKQQGDVTLLKIKNVDLTNATKVKATKKGFVLAAGEHTNHHHVVEECSDIELYQLGEKLLLKLEKKSVVTHEEHKPVTLEPGIWEIGQVYEFDHLSQMSRKVID